MNVATVILNKTDEAGSQFILVIAILASPFIYIYLTFMVFLFMQTENSYISDGLYNRNPRELILAAIPCDHVTMDEECYGSLNPLPQNINSTQL